MEEMKVVVALKWIAARLICAPALLMPYRVRVAYIQGLSSVVHAPFHFFGILARTLLENLNIQATAPALAPKKEEMPRLPQSAARVVVLFSGGTDSTCVAALMAESATNIHLLTFTEYATHNSPIPRKNKRLLEKHFPSVRFVHAVLSVDALVRHLWYERYLHTIATFGLLSLATPGFSSLAWHTRTILYCLEHDISHVVDGLTRELMHFPGHMDETIEQLRALYKRHGIRYENPVREWPVPPDQQFIDKVLVNRHAQSVLGGTEEKTTGDYLYRLGIFPSPNVKGSALDFSMQHDCYPFSLYNILAFWGYLSFEPYPIFCGRIAKVMRYKIEHVSQLLDEYRRHPHNTLLTSLCTEHS